MKTLTILSFATAVSLGFGVFQTASAASGTHPMAFVSSDSPGYANYQMLIRKLDADGAEFLVVESTWLGRVRLVCEIDGLVREVVISPNTGEIRRDVILGTIEEVDFPGKANGASNRGRSGDRGKSQGKGKGKGNR